MEELESTDLGLEVRELFIEYKTKPGPDGKLKYYKIPNGAFQKCFEKAAEVIESLNANPMTYIQAQFHNRGDGAKLLPQFLATDKAIDRYLDFVSNKSKVTIDEIFEENVRRLKAQMQLGFAVKEILMSKSFNFRPWFRLCITKEPIPELMEDKELREKALSEFNNEVKELLVKRGLDYKRILVS